MKPPKQLDAPLAILQLPGRWTLPGDGCVSRRTKSALEAAGRHLDHLHQLQVTTEETQEEAALMSAIEVLPAPGSPASPPRRAGRHLRPSAGAGPRDGHPH